MRTSAEALERAAAEEDDVRAADAFEVVGVERLIHSLLDQGLVDELP